MRRGEAGGQAGRVGLRVGAAATGNARRTVGVRPASGPETGEGGSGVHNLIFRWFAEFRQNYWFWPSAMTLAALLLGFLLPMLDAALGTGWVQSVGFIRPTQVDGARAILTTLAGATLGVAGVAFSVTIVAVSFASSNYGPRLIGNFMADRTNQIVLGVFVATFVYCITVLSTVHARLELADTTREAFVPQLSVWFALLLTLTAVGALIVYIHHIPESINIMNLTAGLGHRLRAAVTRLLDAEEAEDEPVDVELWRARPRDKAGTQLCATAAGYLQQIDLEELRDFARERKVQIVLHRAPGDFLVPGETVMTVRPGLDLDRSSGRQDGARRLRNCFTQGANRTGVQDVLFLSDQLVDVLGRALSPGINDPHTAILCLDWLRSGLAAFAGRVPPRQARPGDAVLYRRVTFEDMLDRSFDRMRQYVAADRTVTLHALRLLADLGRVAARPDMTEACARQMRRLAVSAREMLAESAAQEEVAAELDRALAELSRPPAVRGGTGGA